MTFKLVESPMGSKYIVLKKCWIFAPSDGPKSLFQYLFLTIIDNIYKTVSSILLLRKVSNPDNFGTVAGISYISFILKDSKKKKNGKMRAMRKIDRQRDKKEVQNMLLQELRFTGREFYFRVTIQFITLREERIVEEIKGKKKMQN